METENKGNKTPEEYLKEATFSHPNVPFRIVHELDSFKALELSRTQEREKLIREIEERLTLFKNEQWGYNKDIAYDRAYQKAIAFISNLKKEKG